MFNIFGEKPKQAIGPKKQLTPESLARLAEAIEYSSDNKKRDYFWLDTDYFEQDLAYLDGVADGLPSPNRMKNILWKIETALYFKYALFDVIEWED